MTLKQFKQNLKVIKGLIDSGRKIEDGLAILCADTTFSSSTIIDDYISLLELAIGDKHGRIGAHIFDGDLFDSANYEEDVENLYMNIEANA